MRALLVALLVASTALFAAGAIAERSQSGEPAAAEAHEGSERETVRGVDVESTPLIVIAVLGGLGLAALVAAPPGRRRPVLLAVGAIALVWAVLDVREVVHQLGESRTGIALLAIGAALLHLAAGAVAARLAVRGPATIPA